MIRRHPFRCLTALVVVPLLGLALVHNISAATTGPVPESPATAYATTIVH